MARKLGVGDVAKLAPWAMLLVSLSLNMVVYKLYRKSTSMHHQAQSQLDAINESVAEAAMAHFQSRGGFWFQGEKAEPKYTVDPAAYTSSIRYEPSSKSWITAFKTRPYDDTSTFATTYGFRVTPTFRVEEEYAWSGGSY